MAKEYTPSQGVLTAKDALQKQKEKKPGAYVSRWEEERTGLLGSAREPFQYDLSGDALYRQYRQQALRDGKLAMADTMGQAASLTGGYGNSYALTAGQQSYARELQKLNDRIPELYNLALETYNRQKSDLLERYRLLGEQEDRDYSRYRDTVADWEDEVERLQGDYDRAADLDYTRYRDGEKDAQWQAEFDYNRSRDAEKDAQWQAEFDEAKRRYDQEWASKTAVKSGGGGGSGKTKSPFDKALEESIALMKKGETYQTIQGYLSYASMATGLSKEDTRVILRKVTEARDSRR